MHLVFALFAEGPTDRRALPSILTRTATRILLDARIGRQLTVQEQVIFLAGRDNAARAAALCREKDVAHLFVIHCDGRSRRRAEVIANMHDPIRAHASRLCAFDARRVIDLVPSPELEGWLLADPDAIARAVGFARRPPSTSFVCDRVEVETLTDAKRSFDEAVRILIGVRSRAAPYLEQIASEIDLAALAGLASFRHFQASLREGLDSVGAFR